MTWDIGLSIKSRGKWKYATDTITHFDNVHQYTHKWTRKVCFEWSTSSFDTCYLYCDFITPLKPYQNASFTGLKEKCRDLLPSWWHSRDRGDMTLGAVWIALSHNRQWLTLSPYHMEDVPVLQDYCNCISQKTITIDAPMQIIHDNSLPPHTESLKSLTLMKLQTTSDYSVEEDMSVKYCLLMYSAYVWSRVSFLRPISN